LEQAQQVIDEKDSDEEEAARSPNARFIILDLNGKYSETFSDICEDVRIFRAPPVDGPVKPLRLPAWMWNSHEWAAFAGAAPGAQRPLLLPLFDSIVVTLSSAERL
jgi:uncharacterized protein